MKEYHINQTSFYYLITFSPVLTKYTRLPSSATSSTRLACLLASVLVCCLARAHSSCYRTIRHEATNAWAFAWAALRKCQSLTD